MSAKRLYAPSILIDDVEYKCKAKSVSLVPGDYVNFCEPEWTFSAVIELGYAVAGTWNTLSALENTEVEVVLKPEDATTASTNPAATFSIRVPPIPFLTGEDRGTRQSMTFEAVALDVPVFAEL